MVDPQNVGVALIPKNQEWILMEWIHGFYLFIYLFMYHLHEVLTTQLDVEIFYFLATICTME
jgi:hypothetical protein